ncbi:hypothetical protein [Amycolatopsis sp.]|uniref:hypothetical protein n=1 Tax=Amycolatopsis sp. TaxID=37632 RepID=UPI002CF5C925|nr:hypothetical protein [Amycolatopsis sp.]HVV12786.1 hypothetical protein [Amycolatopsis sp.]
MLGPAGTNEHVVVPSAGRPLFWCLYADGGWSDDHVFDTDRPGPIAIPRDGNGNQPVGVVLRCTADHAFTAYVG